MKRCSKCQKTKEFSEFGKNAKLKSGLHSQCRQCTRLYYKRDAQSLPSPSTKFCTGCKRELSKDEFYSHKHRLDGLSGKCKQCLSKATVASRFSITVEQYKKMLESGCEACGSFDKLCIDHDHACCNYSGSCGKCIRGVLCSNCNSAEGFIKDIKQANGLLEYMKSKGIL